MPRAILILHPTRDAISESVRDPVPPDPHLLLSSISSLRGRGSLVDSGDPRCERGHVAIVGMSLRSVDGGGEGSRGVRRVQVEDDSGRVQRPALPAAQWSVRRSEGTTVGQHVLCDIRVHRVSVYSDSIVYSGGAYGRLRYIIYTYIIYNVSYT